MRQQNSSGFALLVVLLGIAVLTVTYAASIRSFAQHVKLVEGQTDGGAARALSLSAMEAAGLQAAASLAQDGIGPRAPPGPRSGSMRLREADLSFTLIDAGGLVDLNTAAPDLLVALFDAHDLPGGKIVAQITARRTGQIRFDTASQVAALDHMTWEGVYAVLPHLTVYSGRRGIDPASAPIALLAALAGTPGSRDALEHAVPVAWRSAPTRRVFHVVSHGRSARGQTGVIGVTAGRGYRMRILELPQ